MMKAIRSLPVDYVPRGTLDFSHSKAALIVVNVIGLVLMGLFLLLGVWFLNVVSPGVDVIVALWSVTAGTAGLGARMIIIALALVVTLGVGALHELVHGLFFWLFTRKRPTFGARSLYFYAGAPDWYLRRGQHLIVGLMPFVLLTLVGMGVTALVPAAVAAWVLLAIVANAGGAAGDLMAAVWLLGQPRDTLVRDTGLAITIYQPEPGSEGAE
jgi:hypothetical protein